METNSSSLPLPAPATSSSKDSGQLSGHLRIQNHLPLPSQGQGTPRPRGGSSITTKCWRSCGRRPGLGMPTRSSAGHLGRTALCQRLEKDSEQRPPPLPLARCCSKALRAAAEHAAPRDPLPLPSIVSIPLSRPPWSPSRRPASSGRRESASYLSRQLEGKADRVRHMAAGAGQHVVGRPAAGSRGHGGAGGGGCVAAGGCAAADSRLLGSGLQAARAEPAGRGFYSLRGGGGGARCSPPTNPRAGLSAAEAEAGGGSRIPGAPAQGCTPPPACNLHTGAGGGTRGGLPPGRGVTGG